MDNSYVRFIIDRSHNIDVSKLQVIRIEGEKVIDFEKDFNYLYFYLKEGNGKINNINFSGEGSSLIIYSENPSGKISISSLTPYIDYYCWNETKIRSQNIVDLGHGGKFIMEKDFPFEFYTRVDDSKDITFNIELFKIEYLEKISISEHIFEITAYVVNDNEIDNLNNNASYQLNGEVYKGYYNSSLSLGTVVLKREDIALLASSTKYHKYLYVIIKKLQNVKVTYNHVEGQFIFVSMNYIYSTIPKGFLISSHLSEGQRAPHLYTFDGRKMTIEIIYLGEELVYKLLKYKLYQTGSEELYADYDGFIIKRRKEKNKIYIDVSPKNNEAEGNTTPNKLIFCIFSKNEGHVASGNIECNLIL